VAQLQFDRHGSRAWKQAGQLLDAQRTRQAVGEVAVAFGRCSEPSNVSAGGGQCPLRFRCLGCEHFSTDVSYLPELRSYLDDLLRTRERLQAMATADDWAKREAMPSEEEITRLRRLIRRVSENLESLTPREQAEIHDAVTAVRKTPPGVPRHPPGAPAPSRRPAGAPGMTGNATAAARMTKGRQADSGRRRERVLSTLAEMTRNGRAVTVSALAKRAALDRSFLYRHPDLLAQAHLSATQPPPGAATAPSRASLQADLLAVNDRCRRWQTRSGCWSTVSAPSWASKSGSERGSARRPTSTVSRPGSSTLNSRTST
jgi:uncharacterized protein DUF6262